MEVEFILCQNCEGGFVENDGVKSVCPVCDGEPKFTYLDIKEYARQIDSLTKANRELRSR